MFLLDFTISGIPDFAICFVYVIDLSQKSVVNCTCKKVSYLIMDIDHKEKPASRPAPKKRNKQKQYLESNLNLAIAAVQSKVLTLGKAAKLYGVPKGTLHFRLSAKWSGKIRRGPNPVLTADEENKLVCWIKQMERRGFPCTKEALFSRVKVFLDATKRTTIFKDNTPGYKWLELFMKRCENNDALSIRKPESITHAAATVGELDIKKWFQHIEKYITEENLSSVLKDPRRVLNGDETMFLFDPVTKSVIATKGNRNVYLVQQADPKKNITVLFTFDADGYMFPPDVILPYKRLSKNILMSFQQGWGIGKSERGWMDRDNFEAYIQNILYPSLVERKIPFPVIYFVDGHSSHTGIDAAELCASLGIILVALFPNATHIMQPCDVAIFKPLKDQWTKTIDQWKMKNEGRMFTIDHFGAALETAIKAGINSSTVRAGFRRCGLFPFDEDAIDYSRCLSRIPDAQSVSHSISMPSAPSVPKETCDPTLGMCTDAPRVSDSSLLLPVLDSPLSSAHLTVSISSCVPDSPQLLLIPDSSQGPTKSPVKDSLFASSSLFGPPVPEISNWPVPDSSFVPLLSPLPHQLSPIADSPPMLHTTSSSKHPPNLDSSLMEQPPIPEPMLPPTPQLDNTSSSSEFALRNTGLLSRRISITNFLQLPQTPKRKGITRNYKQKRHFILTAAERLQELEQKEKEKENTAIRRQEAIELRAAKKANIERQKQERKILMEERRALKKAEIAMKKEQRDKRKMQKMKNKEPEARKKTQGNAKPKKIRH